jgi:catechol 2,3-dioxygenase-like lactoylglutathione lyase family enzyme
VAHIDRVAFRVDDLDAAVSAFNDVFGMEFEVTDVDSLGLRVAIGENGIELVQVIADDPPIVRAYAGGVLAAISVKVDDIDPVKQKLLARGAQLINEVETVGLREFYCLKDTFHGIPLTVAQYGDSFLEAIHGPGEMPPGYAPKVTWNKREFGPVADH